jgi:hypothetical protein
MPTPPTEITTALGTLSVSVLIYLITTFIQQRTKKNNKLRLIGTVYGPLRHFLDVRYIGVVSIVLLLIFLFLIFLSFLPRFLGIDLDYLLDITTVISFVAGVPLFFVLFKLWIKRDQKIRELVEEISAYITVDVDSLTLRWKALYWGTLVLAERYFLFIFIVVLITTLVFSFLNNGFKVLGAELIEVYLISFTLSLCLAELFRYISLRLNYQRLKVYFFDLSDEIESRLFNLVKEPSLCLCIVDDKGNKHCGSLEGITYSVLIRDKGGILVGIPYDHVYRVEECKAKDDTVGSTLQPYL